MKKEKVISVNNLNYSVEDNEILKFITFDIYKKDFVGIIGPNGAGKSTLIKILIGEIENYQGKVEINGKIGYVPQKDEFDRTFPIKAYEVVLMGMYKSVGLLKRYKKSDIEKVRETMKKLNIEYLFDRNVGKLSGGEYQKVSLARALVSDPDILILDEPEAGVDKKGQNMIYDILERLNDELGLTIILVSHDISMVVKKTNKVMCLNRTLHCHKNAIDVTADDLKNIYAEEMEILVHINQPLKVVSKND
ncbi:metal ABC transporter ATP-binding protein [Marinitoga sp. 1135]|uniref:ATPase component of Mn/Zn ABC-type transporter n=1 Tax=Marinitoga piezophila (strain DSM 14283 / JCM 11233 / KA3) TaxID=443254 RepID=H2J7I8_MARPK|nr:MULTISPECIES: ABC transporter ATP-binding protein [Marinitoga]AEX86481.1 ATPase component of Mn/Zn ABC-type transporter [Marinitoga piezophila KA3]APT76865.1 metal ABC transporter ATP-binding protein [Marinitoga sp. 1137]NUU96621.1 metal ABC transporter ATP-binding protein [Marinitoga sp. 1135]NUU98557.1 metal ABC transporter ATP-binding protein [Marinitoga sp. 1138]